jgi:hypothetical protein
MLTDEELQARLAQAFREQADPVTAAVIDPAPIWRKATGGRRGRNLFVSPSLGPARAGRTVWGRLIAAAASATAVALLVTGVWLVTHRTAQAQQPALATRGDRLPPYYVWLEGEVVQVLSSATGQVLARARVPTDGGIPEITVAGNDGSFVISQELSLQPSFYELHVSKGGRSVRLTSLHIPSPSGTAAFRPVSMAVSPDGRELAITRDGGIELVTLATGSILRTWTAPDGGGAFELSWADHGSELGFAVISRQQSNMGYYTVNVESPGNDLGSARQVVPPNIGGKALAQAVLSPNGSVIALLQNPQGTRGYLVQFPAGTGHRARTLLTFPYDKSGFEGTIVGWDAAGSHLMLESGFSSIGWLDGTHYSQLPGSSAVFRYPEPAFAW